MAQCSNVVFAGYDIAAQFGVIGLMSADTNIVLSGHLDAPDRIGKVYNDWADENSIEPYVRQDELFWGGRDIIVDCVASELDYAKITAFNKVLDDIDGEEDLVTDYGTFPVTFTRMDVVHLADGYEHVILRFRQAVVPIMGVKPSERSGGYGIGDYSWEDIGVIPCRPDNGWSRADSKQLETSVYGYEYNRQKWHNMNIITMNFLVRAENYAGIEETVGKLDAIMRSEGKKSLSLRDGSLREVFMEKGFKVTGIRITNSECYAYITMPVVEIKQLEEVIIWGDNTGQALGNKHNQGLAYTE